MDASIADTINRIVAEKIAAHLDTIDAALHAELAVKPITEQTWFRASMSDTMMGTGPDRAWLLSLLAFNTPDVEFDGSPADADWDNLFHHFRAEIEARRDPQSPPVRAQSPCEMV